MGTWRKLLIGLFTASSLILLYPCVHLEKRPSWSIHSREHLQVFALAESRNASKHDQNTESPESEPSAPVHGASDGRPSLHPGSNSQVSSRPVEGSDKTRTRFSTKAPVVKPQRPTKATRSTKEPAFIGDSYLSEDKQLQTLCSDGLQSRVKKSEFGERYLNNIPVLMLAKHATPEQYKRLKKYTPVHGWSGINYRMLVETLSLLNSSANLQMFDDWKDRSKKSECIRCAVVGNGGILNNSKKGEEIDSHHYVFRTNGAIIKGFEQDVGSRTTHYTFTTTTLSNSYKRYKGLGFKGPPLSKETRYVMLPSHERDYLMVKAAVTHTRVERGIDRGQDPTNMFGKDVSAKKLKMLHPDFMRYLRNRFLHSKYLTVRNVRNYRPSTGAVMLLAALHTCDEVSAYGFMTPGYEKFSRYYYDKGRRPVGFTTNHDLKMELVLWQQLHQAGLMRLYTRE
ncbi:alpha-N-acetylgalactosaminide alpha-2,6-sialyltransferase 2-like [Labrus mixtus]|uniref:alpha-N-acetylgalactosaminide alpha-2,6-sialyltransferase 2-like n=1 Tax=Labrus mixtus TaxID=508554 RepID=UPI0029C02538|nr:alpha-N-acetylgalactosaminide alpha-2,6-sialyltransferase 2-like [Labrus mixtus]